MKFKVIRTSEWDNKQPCEEAVLEKCISIDVRTFKSPEEFKKKLHQDWYAAGTNHRLIDGGIARDFPDEAWFIEIGTLEGLISFIDKYGEVIVGRDPDSKLYKIEIYDDYRE